MPSQQSPALVAMLQLLASHPGLLVDHAQAYAGLLASEAQIAALRCKRQTILLVVAIASFCVAAVLLGVAWMLFALGTPLWALLSAPLPALLVGGGCLLMASRPMPAPPFSEIKRQWADDLAMLQETMTP